MPRPWCRARGGGSQLLFGPDTWPGQVQSGMRQTEGVTPSMRSLGTSECSGSSLSETWGAEVPKDEGGALGQPSTPLSQHCAPLGSLWENQGHPRSFLGPCWWLLLTQSHSAPEGIISFTVKWGWSRRPGQTFSDPECKAF